MSKFNLGSSKRINWRKIATYALVALALIILLTQIERLVTKGSFFGYEVRDPRRSAAQSRNDNSGSFPGAKVSKENSKSIACERHPSNEVKDALGGEVERLSGFVPDRTKPYTVSTCIYRTKDGKKTASILFRELADDAAADKALAALKNGQKTDTVTGVGDEAIFNTTANQLTVRSGKTLTTVTVPKSSEQTGSNKDVAIAVAKIGL